MPRRALELSKCELWGRLQPLLLPAMVFQRRAAGHTLSALQRGRHGGHGLRQVPVEGVALKASGGAN